LKRSLIRIHDVAVAKSISSFLMETTGDLRVSKLVHKAAEKLFDLRLARIATYRKIRLPDLALEMDRS